MEGLAWSSTQTFEKMLPEVWLFKVFFLQKAIAKRIQIQPPSLPHLETVSSPPYWVKSKGSDCDQFSTSKLSYSLSLCMYLPTPPRTSTVPFGEICALVHAPFDCITLHCVNIAIYPSSFSPTRPHRE